MHLKPAQRSWPHLDPCSKVQKLHSAKPLKRLVGARGFEPRTSCAQVLQAITATNRVIMLKMRMTQGLATFLQGIRTSRIWAHPYAFSRFTERVTSHATSHGTRATKGLPFPLPFGASWGKRARSVGILSERPRKGPRFSASVARSRLGPVVFSQLQCCRVRISGVRTAVQQRGARARVPAPLLAPRSDTC